MMSGKSKGRNIGRRTALKKIGYTGGVASGVSLMGSASGKKGKDGLRESKKRLNATTKRRELLLRKYNSQRKIDQAVQDYGIELLKTLADMGHLDNDDPSVLPTNALDVGKNSLPPGDSFIGVTVNAKLGDKVDTAVIMISKHTSHHHVSLYIQPEVGVSYSYVTSKTDGSITYITSKGGSTNMVEPTDECETRTYCGDFCHYDEGTICIRNYYYEEYYQCCPDMGCGYIGKSDCLDGCSCCNC